eukprot:3049581-Rhodomonas_salina.6
MMPATRARDSVRVHAFGQGEPFVPGVVFCGLGEDRCEEGSYCAPGRVWEQDWRGEKQSGQLNPRVERDGSREGGREERTKNEIAFGAVGENVGA